MTELDTFENGIGLGTLENTQAMGNVPDEDAISINGVAIPENTILKGGREIEHFYPPAMAEKAARALEEQIESGETVHLVSGFHDLDGMADAEQVIGEITKAGYSPGVGTVFEGETIDKEIAQKINNGYVNISPSISRGLGELDEQMQARKVNEVGGFRDIAVVARGQDGAKVEVGNNPAIEALSREIQIDTLKQVAGVEFEGTATGKLDEAELPTEGFESHYLYPGETKSESSYPVVDADGNLRKGNVESAWQLGARGDIDAEEHDRKLKQLAQEFESVPEWATESDTMSLDDAKETIAEEYGIDTETLEERLSESDEEDENTVVLIE